MNKPGSPRSGSLRTPQQTNTIVSNLTRPLLELALLPLAGDESKGDDTRDVHLGTEDLALETELLYGGLDVLETLLVVGTSTADPDLDVVLDEERGNLADGADDTLEGRGDVCEVGNTTTNEEDLALGVLGSADHEIQDGLGVVEGLRLGGSTRVLTVVGELIGETSRGNGVGVDDGSTTTSNESPDSALGVQDGELERSTSLGIQLSDVSLLLGELAAERSRELHGRAGIDADLVRGNSGDAQVGGRASDSPLDTTLEVGGLVKLSSQIEEVDGSRCGIGVGDNNQGVDLKVGELAVYVDRVQAGDEVDEDIVDASGNLLEESSGDLLVGRELGEVNGNQELLSLLVDITNIDTTLVSEEDPVTLKEEIGLVIMLSPY